MAITCRCLVAVALRPYVLRVSLWGSIVDSMAYFGCLLCVGKQNCIPHTPGLVLQETDQTPSLVVVGSLKVQPKRWFPKGRQGHGACLSAR